MSEANVNKHDYKSTDTVYLWMSHEDTSVTQSEGLLIYGNITRRPWYVISQKETIEYVQAVAW